MRMTYKRKRMTLFRRSYAAFFFKNYFDTVKNLKEKNRQTIRLTRILGFNTKNIGPISLKHTSFEKESNLIRIYISIEKEMCQLLKHRSDGYSFIEEDYGHALLEPAIERVSGNTLRELTDSKFAAQCELLKTKYKNIYYAEAHKYKLPTISVLAFILRLITPVKK